MANTLIADMVVPSNFASYIVQETTSKSAFLTSGAVVTNSTLAITKGGKTLTVPHFNPLVGAVQLLDDSNPMTVNKVTTGEQVGVINARGQAFSANDLASGYAGADVVSYIGSKLGTYWADVIDDHAIAVVRGALAASASTNVLDISGGVGDAAVFSASAFIDARGKLGDARSKLKAIIVHSAVVGLMEKQDLIEYKLNSEGKSIATYRGLPVIECDKLTAASGVYTMILVGENAITFSEGMDLLEFETERSALAGDTRLVTRRSYVLHPNGFSYAGTVGNVTPSDAAFATGSNWTKVFDTKNIPLVGFKFKIEA
ncbi:major capsid protein [Escherichia coli]|uniref:major capsid protein n=1 Tax=Escherichia coli TaxID=562 RepID=UPI000E20F9B8|nr:major capsid protein [Escherichia coli]